MTSKHDLTQDLGQMIVAGFHGTDLSGPWGEALASAARDGLISGVILFYYNIKDPPQVRHLVQQIRDLPSPEPLLVVVDQEGGMVQRFKAANGFRDFPSPKQVAESSSLPEAKVLFAEMARLLADLGCTMNFAPSVDLDGTPPCDVIGALGRSFSADPTLVTAYGRAFIEAHLEGGVIPAIKHFPGHGRASGDSHWGLVDITDTWTEEELVPFKNLAAHTPAVLTAHLLHRGIDPLYPATLSKLWIDRLRHELQFPGVIITDCMHMGAIQGRYGFSEATLLAAIAGHDILLFGNNPKAAKGVKDFQPNPNLARDVIKILQEGVKSGKLSDVQVRESATRIRAMKRLLNQSPKGTP